MAHSLNYHIGESVRAIEVEIERLLDVVDALRAAWNDGQSQISAHICCSAGHLLVLESAASKAIISITIQSPAQRRAFRVYSVTLLSDYESRKQPH